MYQMTNDLTILANFWIDPKAMARYLKVKLDRGADFQVLKEFEWGVLGYDYEEGIKFRCAPTEEAVRQMEEYIRKVLTHYDVDPDVDQGRAWSDHQSKVVTIPWLTGSFNRGSSKGDREFFTSIGWKWSKSQYSWVSKLKGTRMSEEQMNQARAAQAAADAAVHEPVVDPEPTPEQAVENIQASHEEEIAEAVAADPTPADPNTVGGAAVAIAEETKTQAAEKKAAEKKPRRAPVRGVVAKARELLAAGTPDVDILEALKQLYVAGGREEKNAKESAGVVLHDVKNRQLKPKTTEQPSA